MKYTRVMFVVLVMFVVMALSAAQASSIQLVTSPIGGNTVDWSQLNGGIGGTTISHSFAATAANGDTVTGKFAGANTNKGRLVIQGGSGLATWNGQFVTGEYAVYSDFHGPITFSAFAGTSYDFVGAYFQQNAFGPFTAQLDAYNGNTLLGSVSLAGNSQFSPGTALFIGALDTNGPQITKWVFSESAGTNTNDFAVATMYLGVPEPSTMVLLGTGLIGLAGLARRRMGK